MECWRRQQYTNDPFKTRFNCLLVEADLRSTHISTPYGVSCYINAEHVQEDIHVIHPSSISLSRRLGSNRPDASTSDKIKDDLETSSISFLFHRLSSAFDHLCSCWDLNLRVASPQ